MSNAVLKGNASGTGTVTLETPNTNSDLTISLPAAAGTMMVSGNQPAFGASDTSTTATAGVFTLISFATEIFDTASAWDGDAFTPQVAGYYQVNATTTPSVVTVAGSCAVQIRKNGSSVATGNGSYATAQTINPSVSAIVFLNGSTDYIEIYGRNVGNANLGSSTASSCLLRTA
jgi:hypothetical protein